MKNFKNAYYALVKAFPKAKTELGALTLMGLTAGIAEIALLRDGFPSTSTPLAT